VGNNLTLEETKDGNLFKLMLVFTKALSELPSYSFFSVLLGLLSRFNFFVKSTGADIAFAVFYIDLVLNLGDIYYIFLF
jgi:hypothetical protein